MDFFSLISHRPPSDLWRTEGTKNKKARPEKDTKSRLAWTALRLLLVMPTAQIQHKTFDMISDVYYSKSNLRVYKCIGYKNHLAFSFCSVRSLLHTHLKNVASFVQNFIRRQVFLFAIDGV